MRSVLLERAREQLRDGTGWAGLPGDALSFVLADVLQDEGGLVVVDEPDAAEELVRGLRFFHREPKRVELFPADDVRPYDGFSPSSELVGQRIRVLHRLHRGDAVVVVAPVRALLQRIPTRGVLAQGTLELEVGSIVDRDDLVRRLSEAGYLLVSHVQQAGTFAVRGDVVDIWSAGLGGARRLDFFDDEVEEIRVLRPSDQRAVKRARRALILPAREERLDRDALTRAHGELSRLVSEQGRGLATRRRILEELRAGIRFSAVEDLLPALVATEPPLEALGRLRTFIVHPNGVGASARDTWRTAARRWSELDDEERPLVPPGERLVEPEKVIDALVAAHPVYEMTDSDRAKSLGAAPVQGLMVRGAELGPLMGRLHKLASDDVRVALVARTTRRAEMLEQLFDPHGLELVGRVHPSEVQPGQVSLLVGDLPKGFVAAKQGWAFIPATALFGGSVGQRATQRAHELFNASVNTLAEIKQGDAIVHRTHGIGLFQGLVRLSSLGQAQDFVKLEYRGGDVMYLPATSLGELSKYASTNVAAKPRLDRLGGATWATRKGKVSDSLLAKATELVAMQARRDVATRPPYPPPGPWMKAFVARFPYTETPDQAVAIAEVQDDLSGDAPMDRLICGDVGFGKTEVAMRAAIRVVEGGRQAAVLCPTTVLAFQHLSTFRERFSDLPVRIEMLSRFSSSSDQREVLAGLRAGTIDIVIGTHRLLGRGVRFSDLGLMVIDEEHRFGVNQKAKLKKLRSEADVLAMSATPIPRTLQMALTGIRKMSVMTTPPTDRRSVRTTIARLKRARVRDAILVELERGGQVYFVHNRIESIEAIRRRLEEWVPEARFRIAHGQMGGEDLEEILLAFMRRDFDVLLSTSIVESGIDLPNVNTMLVNRADRFGLAQLYQLRGRVGRSSARGNCILLTPEKTSGDARHRLQVLVDNTRLGSGFSIASADLELRGGGNLLGDAQSGNINAVGYDIWVELLDKAVQKARGQAQREAIDPEVETPLDAFIPESLVPDVNQRIGWYRRFSDVSRADDVEQVMDDFEGEFGELTPEVRALAGLVRTRILCRELGVVRCSWHRTSASLELHEESRITPEVAARAIAEHPKRFSERVEHGVRTLSVRFTPQDAEHPFRYLRWVFARLQIAAR